ncbi:hypothetical protein D3C78_997640 [compost metagenome]
MENIHASIGQRLEELAQRLRGLHQTRGVVLLLPLGEAEDDRETFTDRGTHGLNQFNGEARTVGQAAAVFVGTLVAAFPEELVDQVTVGAVDFHAVHADALGVPSSQGERGDHVLDILLGHAVHNDLAVLDFFRRAIARYAGVRLGADTTYAAHMPQLRNDLAAFGVNGVDDFLPAGQRRFTIEMRNVRVAVGSLVTDGGAFGDDQADARSGATTVVLDHFGVRHAAWGKGAGHRRHDDAGRQFEGAEVERFEQGFDGHGTLHRE